MYGLTLLTHLLCKPGDLSLSPRSYVKVEGEDNSAKLSSDLYQALWPVLFPTIREREKKKDLQRDSTAHLPEWLNAKDKPRLGRRKNSCNPHKQDHEWPLGKPMTAANAEHKNTCAPSTPFLKVQTYSACSSQDIWNLLEQGTPERLPAMQWAAMYKKPWHNHRTKYPEGYEKPTTASQDSKEEATHLVNIMLNNRNWVRESIYYMTLFT